MKKKKNRDVKLPIIPFVFSSFFLVFGTYAWFTYFSDVDSTMTGHVIGWNIDFDGKTNIENKYSIVIDDIYPGMKDYLNEFKITNHGEIGANISISIISAKILGEEYKVGEIYAEETLTSETLMNIIKEKYPFKMSFEIDKDLIHHDETSIFNFSLSWPFETYIKNDSEYTSDIDYYILENNEYQKISITEEEYALKKDELYILNDQEDTYWGIKSHEYKNRYPEEASISIEIIINANQHVD